MNYKDYPDLVEAVAASNGVETDLVWKILELEPEARHLHAYGNRPVFRKKLAAVVDAANPSGAKSAPG